MASAEMHYLITARWLAVLVAAALSLASPAIAQDEAPAGESGNTNTTAGEDASQDTAGNATERYFIRSAGDSGRLAQRYPHLAVWLEPDGAPRALALVEREATDTPEGAMVILADEGQTANHVLIEGLRRRLTEAGWAAMSMGNDQVSPALQLARQRELVPGATRPGGSSPEGQPVMIDVNDQAAEELLEAHRDEMNARLEAAVAWFTERDYSPVVLVGVGRGAAAINDFLPGAQDAVSAVAWVAPEFGERTPDELVSELRGANVRLLDMYPSRSSAGPVRQAAFRRAGVKGYRALKVPFGGGESAGAIASRLAGWADGD
ncbi:DUF3530 family protein [Marinobacter sp.]|uniref:DUF3530 family protein n=1 Tax=Marinobacter sp. TaxID=50741 RepID=UPI00356300B9